MNWHGNGRRQWRRFHPFSLIQIQNANSMQPYAQCKKITGSLRGLSISDWLLSHPSGHRSMKCKGQGVYQKWSDLDAGLLGLF
jgi:hypothetical protein